MTSSWLTPPSPGCAYAAPGALTAKAAASAGKASALLVDVRAHHLLQRNGAIGFKRCNVDRLVGTG